MTTPSSPILTVREQDGSVQVVLHYPGQTGPGAPSAAVPFADPLSAEEREDLRWYLEDYLTLPVAVYQERGGAIAARLRGWGERLFAAVFGTDKPGHAPYIAAGATGTAPRLRLESASPAFLALPWELLHAPGAPDPLALTLAGIDRALPARPDAGPPAAPPPMPATGAALRVLMVIARPYDNDIGFRLVARPLLERLDAVAGRVELEVLRPPTFAALRTKLTEARAEGRPYQVVHFDGHGDFRPPGEPALDPVPSPDRARRTHFREPQGELLFEAEDGRPDPVAAGAVAAALAAGGVPLVVLNACRSAMLADGAAAEAAVATRLLGAGAGAVVAMGYSVYAAAAAEFMAVFYEELFAGRPVSEAVAAGRRHLHRANRRPSLKGPLPLHDWLVPVHYAQRDLAFPGLRATRPGTAPPLAEVLAALGDPARAGPAGGGLDDLAPVDGVFVGRDDAFRALERMLRLTRVAVVHGLGGTGKTELAKAFGRWWRTTGGVDRPDWVFFHSFEPGLASFGLDGVVSQLGQALWGPEFLIRARDPDQRRAAVLQVLRQQRLLLIWDNVESVHSLPDPTGATPPLDDGQLRAMREFLTALVRDGRSAVLLTSRSPEDWLGAEVARLELGGLEPLEAAEYADRRLAGVPAAPARRAQPAFAELMELLAGHPLSLRLMLPHLERTEAAELVAALRAGVGPAAGAGGRGDSLAASVDYSLAHLPAADRERLLALALVEGVADADVLAVMSQEETAPARFRGAAPEAWAAALDRAGAVGLLAPRGEGMYALHPALPGRLRAHWQRAAGTAFAGEVAAAEDALLAAQAAFGDWLWNQIQTGAAELALALLAAQRRNFGRALDQALRHGHWKKAQALLQPLNAFWDTHGLSAEARGWADRCRAAVEGAAAEPPALDSPAGALWQFVVGAEAIRALEAGDLAGAEAEYHALRRRLEASSGDTSRRHLAGVYHQLGIEAQKRGDLAGAERWYRQALAINEALGDRPGLATTYHQLGVVAQLRGDLARAERRYRQSLEIKKALGNRPSLAMSCHQLGQVAQLRGDLAGAERWTRQALEFFEALGNRPGLAKTYGQLGVLAAQRGNPTAALDWTVQGIALFPEFPHPLTEPVPHNLARFTAALGMAALEASWRRVTGAELPDAVRQGVLRIIAELGLSLKPSPGDAAETEGRSR